MSHYYTCTNFDFVCSLHWSYERVKVWLFIVLHQSWLPPSKAVIYWNAEIPLLYKRCLSNFTLKGSVSISSKSISKKTGRVTRPKLEQNTNAVNIRRPFDPTAHELDANFRLTRFADLKGRGCKVPQEVLLKLLEGLADDGGQQDEQHFMAHMSIPRIGTFCA